MINKKITMAQQTLEEAADKYFPFADKMGGETYTAYKGFIAGAKWMEKQMYSEEEVLKLLITFSDDRTFLKKEVAIQWFEQFKNK